MLGVKYPTVLNVYGGPEVQTVSNTFKVRRRRRFGFICLRVMVDEMSRLFFRPSF